MKILYEMPTAYVLINCDSGFSEEEIIKELKKLTEVIEVSGVYGVYDIILKIKSETMDKLRETITWHVRRIDKVRSTLTMIVIEGQGEKGKRDWISDIDHYNSNSQLPLHADKHKTSTSTKDTLY